MYTYVGLLSHDANNNIENRVSSTSCRFVTLIVHGLIVAVVYEKSQIWPAARFDESFLYLPIYETLCMLHLREHIITGW